MTLYERTVDKLHTDFPDLPTSDVERAARSLTDGLWPELEPDERLTDAKTLRRAALIVKRRSTKPNGFWLGVLVHLLRDFADKVEEGR